MEALGNPLALKFIELWLIDHRTGALRRAASVSMGFPPAHLEQATETMHLSQTEGMARDVADQGRIICIPDLRVASGFFRRKEALLDGIQGVIGLPVGNDTRELGALLLMTKTPAQLDSITESLLERISQQFSLLTLNLRRGELLQRSQRRLRFITEVSATLGTASNPDAVATALLDALVPRIADAAIIERPTKRKIERSIATAKGVSLPPLDPKESMIPRRSAGRIAVASGTALHEMGARHALIAQLRTSTTVIGQLVLLSIDEPFDDEEELIVKEAARRAGEAIGHAQLFSHHSHISQTLQESLLPPSLPEVEGFEVAARYHAAGDGIDSGGDFYDLFPTGGSSWAAMIGDVQGKGPGAAAITALARYTLRAAALRARRPSRILSLLNEALLSNDQTDRCCTVAFARLVLGDGSAQATVCLAGHLEPLLRHPDGAVTGVGAPGRFLGCFPDTRLTDVNVDLPPGSALIMYTDGVTEARSPAGEEFGEERLRQMVSELPLDASAADLAEEIRAAALKWQGNDTGDDIALLVLRRKQKGK
jgi:serine phosphatase RsbU (regulator of sigma subunit)